MRILTKQDREVVIKHYDDGDVTIMIRRISTGAWLAVALSPVEARHVADSLLGGSYSEALGLLAEAEDGVKADEGDRMASWPEEDLQLDLGERIKEFLYGAD